MDRGFAEVEVTGRLGLPASGDGILAAVEALVARFQSPVLVGLPPLHGGLVGYLGYDVVREVERLPAVPPDDLGQPAQMELFPQLLTALRRRRRRPGHKN